MARRMTGNSPIERDDFRETFGSGHPGSRHDPLEYSPREWRGLEKLPLFWRLQLGGWLGWTVWSLPINFAIYADIGTAFLISCVREITGFALTLGLREIYRRTPVGRLGVWAMAPLIVVICLLAAGIDVASLIYLQGLLGLGAEDYNQTDMLGYLFCLRTLLFVSWSGLYLSFRGLLATKAQADLLFQAEKLRHEAELQMLRAQINPHFLFNAFNTILSEGKGNPGVVALVKALSEYLRYSLSCRHEGFVSLGAEIDAITSYLEVEKARFGGDLILEIAVTDTARAAGVPGVIIQPLVENAIKYGRETCTPPLKVRVAAETGPHALRIEVSNTGRW
ncbi:MAG TPA: histidine kinase, partial [Chthoniobacterales bacterium]